MMATRHPGSFAVALAMACTSLGVTAQLAHGQMVPTNVRAVDSSAQDQPPDGTTWATAYRNIQDALDEATDPFSGIDDIWVAVGSLDAAGNPLGYVPTRLTLNSDDLRTVTFRMQDGDTTAFGIFGGFLGNAPGGGEMLRVQRNPEANEKILDGHFPAPPLPPICPPNARTLHRTAFSPMPPCALPPAHRPGRCSDVTTPTAAVWSVWTILNAATR